MLDNSTLNHSDDKETSPPLKKLKPSLPISSPQENSINQSCSPLFHELANNTLLQKSIVYFMMLCVFKINYFYLTSKLVKEDSTDTY